jgi:hypothetical protein
MSRLPAELRDFLTIWTVDTILDVTKDVDMRFRRQYNRSRMQVLVLDPSLIPILVDVVIGDNVYELHFKVEPEEMHDNLKPLEMEDDGDDFDKMDDGEGGKDEQGNYMQEDCVCNSSAKGSDHMFTSKQTEQQGGNKKSVMHLSLSNSIGVENNMQADDFADDLGDKLSHGALKDVE